MKDFRKKSSKGQRAFVDCLTLLQSLNYVPEYILRYISLFPSHEENERKVCDLMKAGIHHHLLVGDFHSGFSGATCVPCSSHSTFPFSYC